MDEVVDSFYVFADDSGWIEVMDQKALWKVQQKDSKAENGNVPVHFF